ncbi:MAG: site-specific DNA-methyltransferase [Candidatus Asgardarchaeia archaeon]
MKTVTERVDEIREKLKNKLKEIFQFENEDLDFGIYRIMNRKRKEVEKFIERELINEVQKQLNVLSEKERSKLREEFEKIKQKIKESFGEDAFENGDLKEAFRDTPLGKKYYEKRREIESIKITEDLEKEIYNHLINFFTRYYDNGDFISKRRYGKNEKYVIPYNGEEVFLYWTNKDQYYIKTTEYFRKYAFKFKGLTVNFRVIEAEEEKGNIKAQEKKFFVLNEKIYDFDEEKKELNIYFEYRALSDDEKRKYGDQKVKEEMGEERKGQKYRTPSQDKINEEIIRTLEEKIPQNSLARLIFEKEGEKTLIEKHLYKYTRRNTMDYFIHKDLKSFLERELDFYIKNEFLQLENLQILEESGYFDKLRRYLIGVRAFRNIALKIIEFLAQIENFQKKIWEKKKFVIDTHYVITLDKIKEYAGEEFLESIMDDILSNEKQLEEWKELFGIEVKKKEDLIDKNTLEGKEWKKLPIDTKNFDEEFKWKLLVALTEKNDLDEILDGVLIKSENWQALNLLLNKYYEKVQTIYIDPPFNKEQEADYLYKVNYKDSTWITMLENRIRLGRELLNEKGSIFVRCDHNGNMYVRMLMNEIFGRDTFCNEIVVGKTPGKKKTGLSFSYTKDYLVFYGKTLRNVLKELWKKTEKYSFYVDVAKILRKEKDIIWDKADEILREKLFWVDLDHRPGERKENKNRTLMGIEFEPPKGRHWIKSQEKLDELYRKGKARIKCKNCGAVFYSKSDIKECCLNKRWVIQIFLDEDTLGDNWTDISGYSQTHNFQTENSEILLKRIIESTSNEGDLVMDFFLGSGTTTAVAHKLRRKWIGVEMGEHFWTVVLPRMKKVLFYDKSGISKEKDVKEKYNPKTAGGFFKYHTLEQYEDALENIEFEEPQRTLYEFSDYFVKYMLEWETKGSKTFLNIDEMKNPFNYKLKIIENYQQKIVNVDLVETFNYLLGLHVSKYETLEENGRKYVFVFGEKDGKRVAVVWRSIEDIDFEKDKEVIEAKLKEFELDEIYINGEALVKGFRHIEPLFKSLMLEEVR